MIRAINQNDCIGKVAITKSLPIRTKIIPPKIYEMDLTGTLLDPALDQCMGYIDLGKELYVRNQKSRILLVPRTKLFNIRSNGSFDDLSFRYNYLLQHLEQAWHNEKTFGYADWTFVQKLLNAITNRLGEMITGKTGILRRHIMGTRVIDSGRAVAVPDPTLKFGQVGIPSPIMKQLKLTDGDYVILIRHPVLWEHSLLVCKAKEVKHSAISCHPCYCKGMGLDFDGDCVSIVKIPEQYMDEAEKCYIGNDKDFAHIAVLQQEFSQFPIDCEHLDISLPFYIHMLALRDSPSLQDFVDHKKEYFKHCKTAGKYTALQYLNGLEIEAYMEEQVKAVENQAAIKLMLPLAGAFSTKLRYLVSLSGDANLIKITNKFIEKICQEVLDVKHHSQNLIIQEILAIFEKRHKSYKTIDSIVEFLSSYSIDSNNLRSILEYLFKSPGGLTDQVTNAVPIMMATEGVANAAKLDLVVYACLHNTLSKQESALMVI